MTEVKSDRSREKIYTDAQHEHAARDRVLERMKRDPAPDKAGQGYRRKAWEEARRKT